MAKQKYALSFLPLFYEELDHEVSYIAFKLQNPDAANNLLDEVEAAINRRLEDVPDSFEPVPSAYERNLLYYRIYVKNYIIYYVVLNDDGKKTMEVRRFMNMRQNRHSQI